MNGHFSPVGDKPHSGGSYEHGVQVIDENKEFKYAAPRFPFARKVTDQISTART